MLKIAVVAAVLLCALTACGDEGVYTLYRGSKLAPMRIHVATFDAADGSAYNLENCDLAAKLYESQPGVAVKFWCEKGRYKP